MFALLRTISNIIFYIIINLLLFTAAIMFSSVGGRKCRYFRIKVPVKYMCLKNLLKHSDKAIVLHYFPPLLSADVTSVSDIKIPIIILLFSGTDGLLSRHPP